MGKINILTPNVFNMIAAGEVVERPASVVKELVENSVDAGATQVDIHIEEGGIRKIQVSDNGIGIQPDDMRSAFLPHATSKLKEIEDLDTLSSLGFRGEALASIASVSEVTAISRCKGADTASKLSLSAGKVTFEGMDSRAEGTVIEVDNLFFNTPARAKFLKTAQSEQRAVQTLVERLALSNPEIGFTLSSEDGELFAQEGGSLADSICAVFGIDTLDKMLAVDYFAGGIHVSGFTSNTNYSKPTRTSQAFIVNGRAVECKDISLAVDRAYEGKLVKRNYPVCVLNVLVPFEDVDVNVHPRKSEVRFKDKNAIFSAVYHAITNAVDSASLLDGVTFKKPDADCLDTVSSSVDAKTAEKQAKKPEFSQSKLHTGSLFDVVDHTGTYKKAPAKFGDGIPSYYSTSKDTSDCSQDRFVPTDTKNAEDTFSSNNATINEPKNVLNSVAAELENSVNADFYAEKQIKDEYLTNSCNEVFDGNIVGQIFDTYIIVERDDTVYIIDQHAAHERYIYNNLLAKFGQNIEIQSLLVPYKFRLSGAEETYFVQLLPSLTAFGFEIEKNADSYYVYAMPEIVSHMDFQRFLGELFRNMLTEGEIKMQEIVKDMLCMRACKAAIKGGYTYKMNREQIASVLSSLVDKDGKLPEKCPHGRPAVVALTRVELEKLFKRIV